jgi:N-acetylglutamate synthase-like GNAT family acetyltransferase
MMDTLLAFDLPLRLATDDDIPALEALIESSVRSLSQGYYTPRQIESALRHVFGPDTRLIGDGTYYVVDSPTGEIAATEDPLLDPAVEPARIRAFFVHPRWARRGLGRRLFERCSRDAAEAGFTRLELMATLPGEPLYRALGFVEVERLAAPMPDDEELPVVRMTRPLRATDDRG